MNKEDIRKIVDKSLTEMILSITETTLANPKYGWITASLNIVSIKVAINEYFESQFDYSKVYKCYEKEDKNDQSNKTI